MSNGVREVFVLIENKKSKRQVLLQWSTHMFQSKCCVLFCQCEWRYRQNIDKKVSITFSFSLFESKSQKHPF